MFQVLTNLGDTWENVWTESDRITGKETLLTFENLEEAEESLFDFIKETQEAYADGFIDELYLASDFRVEEVPNE